MSIGQVNMSGTPDEYGILIYDVPLTCKTLYNKIRYRIAQTAIRLNRSVYLIPWSLKDKVEGIIEECEKDTGDSAEVFVMKFDKASKAEIEQTAKECLCKDLTAIAERLRDKARKCEEENKNVPDMYFTQVKNRLDIAESLAVLFGFTADVKNVLDSVREIHKAEIEADKYRRLGR